MIEITFDYVLDLWNWLYINDDNLDNSEMDDIDFGQHIDMVFDNVCKEIKDKGFAIKNNNILKVSDWRV